MQPASVDEKLIATLEEAFAQHAAEAASIDGPALKRALGLRSDYLAGRVLAAFDRDGDGRIQREEFLDGVRQLVFGDPRERLRFAFRVHDHDGDGSIDRGEMLRMIALGLAEDDVAIRAGAPERLVDALFAGADRDHDGRISFDELLAAVSAHPQLLDRMTRSEARWIAPNEAVLARIETRRPFHLGRFLENHWVAVLIVALWAIANVAVFVGGLSHGRKPVDPFMKVGRAATACITLNAALIVVPVLRRFVTWIRSKRAGRALPVDDAIGFHKLVGHTLFFFSMLHGVGFVASYAQTTRFANRMLTTRAITGTALLVIFAVMWLFALGPIRRSRRFELFYWSHLLYVVWFVLAIAHDFGLLGAFGLPLVGLVVEHVVRARKRGRRTKVVSAQALRSGVTRLELERPPGFVHRAGDWVFVAIPSIARHEWHPFTVSSAPERSTLTLHVRSLGNWTSALRRTVEEAESRGGAASLDVVVDGPYGSPTAHVFESSTVVMIGAGIGVTPFASVLESMLSPANRSRFRKVHFFWVARDAYSFEWFADLLSELERRDREGILEVHVYMTGGHAGSTALGLGVARELAHARGDADVVTGLRAITHMGHPDWDAALGEIARAHAPSPVDVFFCGPPGLGKKLRPICAHHGMRYREERF